MLLVPFLKFKFGLFLSFFFKCLNLLIFGSTICSHAKNIFARDLYQICHNPWLIRELLIQDFRRASGRRQVRKPKSRYSYLFDGMIVWYGMLNVIVPRGGSISNEAGSAPVAVVVYTLCALCVPDQQHHFLYSSFRVSIVFDYLSSCCYCCWLRGG